MKKAIKGLSISCCLLLCFIPLVVLTTGCTPVSQQEVLDNLLPNLWVFLTHVVATVVLLILAIWLVWRPTKNTLAKRHEYIQNEIKAAEEARAQALKALSDAEKTKVEAFTTAREIVEGAKKDAYVAKRNIENEAKLNAVKIKEDANNEAAKIKNEMKQQMHGQVIDLAFAASSALLKKKITKKDSDHFVDDFINQLEAKEEKSESKPKTKKRGKKK